MSNIINKEEIIRRIELHNPGKFDFSPLENWEYDSKNKGYKQHIPLICKKHNLEFTPILGNAINNEIECPLCKKDRERKEALENLINLIETFWPNKYILLNIEQDYKKKFQDLELTFKCKNCQEIFIITPMNVRNSIRKSSLCQGCRTELSDEEYLRRWNILYGDQYIFITPFNGVNSRFKVKCKYCGKEKEDTANNLLNSRPCLCQTARVNKDNFIERSINVWGEGKFEYLDIDITHSKEFVTLKCLKHNEIFTQQAQNHLDHCCGCPKCKTENLKESTTTLTTEDIVNRGKILYGDKFTYEHTVYKNWHEPIIVTCKDHGDMEVIPHNFLTGFVCKSCRIEEGFASDPETYIYDILKNISNNKKEFYFEPQKSFLDLYYQRPLLFDFYGKINNTEFCIEYQGGQHYFPVKYGGVSLEEAEKNLEISKIRDNLKKEYCKKKNIILIEYTYKQSFLEIKEHLLKFIEDLKQQ